MLGVTFLTVVEVALDLTVLNMASVRDDDTCDRTWAGLAAAQEDRHP